MHKFIISVFGVSVLLTGCNKSVEDKPISELTSAERESVCQSPVILTQLENNFKTHTIKALLESPNTYSPWYDPKKDDVDEDHKTRIGTDHYFTYTSDIFKNGFGKTDVLKITKASSSSVGTDVLTCSAKFSFISDEIYGREFSTMANYDIHKKDNKFTTDSVVSLLDGTLNSGVVNFIEPTEGQKIWRVKFKEDNKKQNDMLRSIADSEFKPVSEDDLYYIYFSQTTRAFSDNELMQFFSSKWDNTNDSFAKEDIKKEELPKIKAKIAKYKNIKNILVYSTSEGVFGTDEANKLKTSDGQNVIMVDNGLVSFITDESYSFDLKGFKYPGDYCSIIGSISINNRGISLDVDKSIRGCVLHVPEDQARTLSAVFSELHNQNKRVKTYSKHYIHIDSIDGNHNVLKATLVKDAVKLYDPNSKEMLLDTVVY